MSVVWITLLFFFLEHSELFGSVDVGSLQFKTVPFKYSFHYFFYSMALASFYIFPVTLSLELSALFSISFILSLTVFISLFFIVGEHTLIYSP